MDFRDNHGLKPFVRYRDPCILFRQDLTNEEEFAAASKYFEVHTQRAAIPRFKQVVGRYSVLPYYAELEQDLRILDCSLINTYKQHQFVADIQEWYPELEPYTPKTWFRVEDVPWMEFGSFVVKGRTNSRKHDWNTKMFAPRRHDIGPVVSSLMEDPLISQQGVVIRKYEPLVKILDGLNGLPITMEFRVFICNGCMVEEGFYWSSYALDVKEKLGTIPHLHKIIADGDRAPLDLLTTVANKIAIHPNGPTFYTIDIAKTESGKWIVVELNDGQMAGLSEINPDNFYRLLRESLSVNR